MTSHLLDELSWRGLVAQSTDERALRSLLDAGPVTLYAGFDPTAPSMQVGNLVPLLTLRRFQLAGHRPVALLGGATGLIGDPSGKAAERQLNDAGTVAAWAERFRSQASRYLDLDPGPAGGLVLDNLEWTAGVSALEFLRDVGKHFTVNYMLGKESVSSRLDAAGISYTEFSYMLLQAFDFLELYRRHDCRLQVGGSDQWGNITAGLELIRRVTGGSAHGLTVPLVTSSTGEKFGKTASGTVWLDPELTTPYAFYQFWVNVADVDAVPYLRYFTFLPREQVDELDAATRERPHERAAQRRLAEELTVLVHGERQCREVVAASQALFGAGHLEELDAATLEAAMAELPVVTVGGEALPPVAQLLADSGLVPSRSAARRTIAEGGAYVNNRKVTDEEAAPDPADFLHGRWLVLRRGRRNLAGVRRAEA